MRGWVKVMAAIAMFGAAVPLWWEQFRSATEVSVRVEEEAPEEDRVEGWSEDEVEPLTVSPIDRERVAQWRALWDAPLQRNPFLSPREERQASQPTEAALSKEPSDPDPEPRLVPLTTGRGEGDEGEDRPSPVPPSFGVRAVIITSVSRRAIVGRQVVEIGEEIEGGRVTVIEPWGILYERDGVVWRLELDSLGKRRNER